MFKLRSSHRFFPLVAVVAAIALSACGGHSSAVPNSIKGQANTITPALGATYNADVYVYAADGLTLLGQGKTDATTGKSSVSLVGYVSNTPVIVKVVVGPGASYYDETSAQNVVIAAGATPFSMLSVLPSATAGQDFSANPLTNMAAKFAGISADKLGATSLSTPLVADKVFEGVAKTNLALGLPAGTNILAPVTPATKAVPQPTGTISNLLVVLATAAPAPGTPATQTPIEKALALSNAVSVDGTLAANTTALNAVNTALRTTTNIGLAISTPVTTNSAMTNALPAAKDAATKTVSSFTGSLTGGN